jgi:pyruvate,orthophosphate dikinase
MSIATATSYLHDVAEGSRGMRMLLGDKGPNIAEITRVLGPDLMPAGLTI